MVLETCLFDLLATIRALNLARGGHSVFIVSALTALRRISTRTAGPTAFDPSLGNPLHQYPTVSSRAFASRTAALSSRGSIRWYFAGA